MKKHFQIILITILFSISIFTYLLCTVKMSLQTAHARNVLFRIIGVTTLAISEDCNSTRGIIEGLGGCLGDVPGGYCYHSSCDIVTDFCITENEYYKIEKN